MNLETDGQEAGTGAEAIAETPLVETPSEATPEQPTGAETPAEPTDAGAESQDKPKQVPWFQKRIDEVTAAKYDAQREAAYWRGQAEAGGRQQPQPPAQQGPPREDQFESYEAFEEARIAHAVEQRLQTLRGIEQREQSFRTYEDRVTKVRDKLPDFDLYVGDPTLPITPLMAEVIRESDVGPEVAYHLGKNRTEAQRIFALPPHRQAAELGRLEAKLAMPAAPNPKPIPPAPPQTVSGLSAGLAKSPDDMSMAEYVEWSRAADKR